MKEDNSEMAFAPVEPCLAQIGNRYLLVVVGAKRSRQLNRGALPTVESRRKKPTGVALEEIAGGKISYRVKEEPGGEGREGL